MAVPTVGIRATFSSGRAGDVNRPVRRRSGRVDAAGLWEAVVVPEDAAAALIAKKDKPARAYLLGALAEDLLLQVAA